MSSLVSRKDNTTSADHFFFRIRIGFLIDISLNAIRYFNINAIRLAKIGVNAIGHLWLIFFHELVRYMHDFDYFAKQSLKFKCGMTSFVTNYNSHMTKFNAPVNLSI